MAQIAEYKITLGDYDRTFFESSVLLRVELTLDDGTSISKAITCPVSGIAEEYEGQLKARDETILILEKKLSNISDILEVISAIY